MNYLIGNWKMNLLPNQAIDLANQFNTLAINSKKTIFGVAPTFLAIKDVINSLNNKKLKIGAQNSHWETSGAYTGEVSNAMLEAIGSDFVIIGHSECRNNFFESQELITQRARGVLNSNMQLVYCVGETLTERESNKTLDIIKEQLLPILELTNPNNINRLVIAYEPVWAIGTGKVASLENIEEVHNYLVELCESTINAKLPLLYGGSVKPDNYNNIIKIKNVNGALVGGASLDYNSFSKLLEISEE